MVEIKKKVVHEKAQSIKEDQLIAILESEKDFDKEYYFREILP